MTAYRRRHPARTEHRVPGGRGYAPKKGQTRNRFCGASKPVRRVLGMEAEGEKKGRRRRCSAVGKDVAADLNGRIPLYKSDWLTTDGRHCRRSGACNAARTPRAPAELTHSTRARCGGVIGSEARRP